ncbi:TAXI family TRAP transporter solute-binding subunit [Ammoniphilus sp. CFH 90114]|uniref:TAXI family TRAP transporter solute-binding subunit n=1 Tax=Ammoniphilus sp. CFH 90114 TaxID=2493665 RepID=UPI00100DF44C|nr:TAXI family TRAP transporter solute-binding subunit [Ammoniphilus sp. CFH 90114]RXT04323.1 TAXI family TRAP transporter solute-binding subunit [Ammoniphilus sp. CFH 90114]
MKKLKWLSTMVLPLALSMVVTACGGGGNQTAPAPAPEPKPAEEVKQEQPKGDVPSSVIIATGGTSGTYYPLGGGMAQIFTDKAGIPSSAQSTGASVENMRLIKDSQVDLAFTQGDIADYASNGTVMFKEGGAINNINAIASLYNETVQIIVAKDSAIQTVDDLKGKRVSVGAPGSGTEANAMQILELHGLTFDDLGKTDRLAFGESASFIQDGTLDAAFVTAGTPTAAVNELAATKGVRVIGISDEKMSEIIAKYPYYAKQGIDAGTYPGFDQAVNTVAVKAQLVARAELDEEFVYKMTKAFYENLDQMKTVHAKAGEIKLEAAMEGVSLKVHPGAAKYFEEKGIKK